MNQINKNKTSGKIYIGSMNMRGSWAPRPDNTKLINVTSMQGKNSEFRKDFSPMSPVEGKYKGYYCFENYWQAGKVFENMDRNKYIDWWKNQTKGKRRYPNSKGKKILHGRYKNKKNIYENYDYINSRKNIYVPYYYNLMKKTKSFKKCHEVVKNGQDVIVYDFDGPRTADGNPTYLLVTKKMLKEKINDPSFPFGHGYIVAASLANIKPKDYTNE